MQQVTALHTDRHTTIVPWLVNINDQIEMKLKWDRWNCLVLQNDLKIRRVGGHQNVHSIPQMSTCTNTANLGFDVVRCWKLWLTSVSGSICCQHGHCKSFNSGILTFLNKFWPKFHNDYFLKCKFQTVVYLMFNDFKLKGSSIHVTKSTFSNTRPFSHTHSVTSQFIRPENINSSLATSSRVKAQF